MMMHLFIISSAPSSSSQSFRQKIIFHYNILPEDNINYAIRIVHGES